MEMPDEFTVVLFRGSGFSCFRHSSFGAQTLTPLADDSLASIPFCMRYPFEFIDQGLLHVYVQFILKAVICKYCRVWIT